jgi:hypothetical protein
MRHIHLVTTSKSHPHLFLILISKKIKILKFIANIDKAFETSCSLSNKIFMFECFAGDLEKSFMLILQFFYEKLSRLSSVRLNFMLKLFGFFKFNFQKFLKRFVYRMSYPFILLCQVM